MIARIHCKNGTIVDIEVVDNFNFAVFCKIIRADGYLLHDTLYIPSDFIGAVFFITKEQANATRPENTFVISTGWTPPEGRAN